MFGSQKKYTAYRAFSSLMTTYSSLSYDILHKFLRTTGKECKVDQLWKEAVNKKPLSRCDRAFGNKKPLKETCEQCKESPLAGNTRFARMDSLTSLQTGTK